MLKPEDNLQDIEETDHTIEDATEVQFDAPSVSRQPKAKKRVQIAYEPSEPKELTPPPTPRTADRNHWKAYREQQATYHQSRVAHYANIFDRMLA